MKALSKVAAALSFAHLAGIGSQARAEEPSKDDEDKDKSKKAKAEDDDKKDQDHEDGDAKGARAEDDKDDDGKDKAEGDDPEKKDDDEKDSKAKKAAKADEDDSDDEMRGNSAAAAARRRERARCAAIFASKAAGKNPTLAANLAFNTSMSRQEALVVLESTPAPAAADHGRSARNPDLGAGGSSSASGSQVIASRWDRAFSAANPRGAKK